MELQLNTGYRQILGMALPISLAMLVPQINFITNNIFLGHYNATDFASAGITGVYYLIFAVVGNGLNNGLQALIARRAGEGQPKEIGKLFYHGVWIALAISVLGIVITYAFAPVIFRATIHSAAVAENVIDFLLIRIWGLPFLYLYIMRNALLVGVNQTRFLVWGTLSEALVNIFLDYGLIFGKFGMPEIGFNGAAYASIAAEITGLIVIYAIIRYKGFDKLFSFFGNIQIDFSLIKKVFVQSSPLILQYGISIASWGYFYLLIEHHGEMALGISNTMRNIFGVFGIFAWAFAATTNTMVSNIIGQGRQNEVIGLVKRISGISLSLSAVIFIMLNLIPHWFLGFFGQGPEFVEAAVPVVRIISVALLLMSVGTVWLNSVTGTGNTVVNLTIELITIVVYCAYVYIVLEYLKLPITWGWASEWVYWVSMFSMAYFYMRSGKWKNKSI